MNEATVRDTAQWQAAFAAFGLSPQRVERLAGGVTNVNVIAVCDGASFVVRRHRGLVATAAVIEEKWSVVARLAELDALVARPLRTQLGHFTYVGQNTYSASAFVPGVTGPDAASPRAFAAMLAAYHRVAAQLHPGEKGSLPSHEVVAWLAAEFARFARIPELRDRIPWIRACDLAERCAARLQTPEALALATLWVHGDVNPGNIVTVGGKLAGFIDFEFVHHTERLYDLATLASELTWEIDDHAIRKAIAREIVTAYDRELPLEAAEFALVDAFRVRRHLAMLWKAVALHGARSESALRNARKNLDLAECLLESSRA